MFFKHALMVAVLATSSFAASAATTLRPYQEISLDSEFITAGAFTDVYEYAFNWAGAGAVTGSIAELKYGKSKDISFGAGALQVFDANNNILLSLDGQATGSQYFEIANLIGDPLVIPTNTFKIVIKGNVIGTGPGTLGSYDFSLQAAPVPEAQSYAMALAGVGIMGLMLRRRKNNA